MTRTNVSLEKLSLFQAVSFHVQKLSLTDAEILVEVPKP